MCTKSIAERTWDSMKPRKPPEPPKVQKALEPVEVKFGEEVSDELKKKRKKVSPLQIPVGPQASTTGLGGFGQ